MLTTSNGSAVLTPAQVNDLIILPLQAQSVAATVSTYKPITTKTLRVPRVTADPQAAWVAEGQEIPLSDAALDELAITPTKVAGLTKITKELYEDSLGGNGDALQVVGDGLMRDTANKVDAAFFGNITGGIAQAGLGSLVTGTAIGAFTNTDTFVKAAAVAQDLGVSIDFWVTSSAMATNLALLKKATGSNEPLFAPDPTQPSRRVIEGRPLLVVPGIAAGVIWGVPKSRCIVAVRRDASFDFDKSIYFTSDSIAVRSTTRVGFGFTQPAAVVKLTAS